MGEDHLEEFEGIETKKGIIALYPYLDIFSMLGFVIFGFAKGDFQDGITLHLLRVYLILIGAPLVAWLLYVNRLKMGWFIRSVYYSYAILIFYMDYLIQKLISASQLHLLYSRFSSPP